MTKASRPARLISDDDFIAALRAHLPTPEEQARIVNEFKGSMDQYVQKARDAVVRGNGFIMIDSYPQ